MASMADVQYSNIYKGAWIDWSKGSFKGATITVRSSDGAIVVAVLALFIAFAGQHLWGLICFAWHQYRMTDRPKKVLEHQQDIALRNNASPAQASWYFVQIAWSWRGHTKRWWISAVLPTAVPLLIAILILTTGILSSSIVRTTEVDVLLRGTNCGNWRLATAEDATITSEYMMENNRYLRSLAEFSKQYGRTCYNKSMDMEAESCKAFTKPSIPYSTNLDAACPFDKTVCTYPDTGNFKLDTGLIDTNKLLGINTRKDNLEFRKATVCALIKPRIFTSITSQDRVGRLTAVEGNISAVHNFTLWHFGDYNSFAPDIDFVFLVDKYYAENAKSYGVNFATHFYMDPDVPIWDQTQFFPRAEFNVSDGDLKILFLQSNAMTSPEPIDDPWFSAHRSYKDPQQKNRTLYRADNLAVPMGCVEQYQFCNPHQNGECTPLTSILPAIGEAKRKLNPSPIQKVILDIFFNAIYMLNTDITTPSYHSPNLLAEQTAMAPWQMPLPKNQWVLELHDMHNAVLSMLQRAVVDYARGPGSPKAQKFIAEPKEGAAKDVCGMIRARADGRFSNISTYGLALTLTFGTLLILINSFIVDVISFVHNRRGTHSVRHQAWLADNLHQLQRQVFEANHKGIWKGHSAPVPVAVQDEMITRVSGLNWGSRNDSGVVDEEKAIGYKIKEREVHDEPVPGRLRRSGISRHIIDEGDGDDVGRVEDLEFGATLTEEHWELAVASAPKKTIEKSVDQDDQSK